VIVQAEQQAQVVLEQVQAEAQEVRKGADQYAIEVLQKLEARLLQELGTVRNGILTLAPGGSRPTSNRPDGAESAAPEPNAPELGAADAD
jgi:hypothetical protein